MLPLDLLSVSHDHPLDFSEGAVSAYCILLAKADAGVAVGAAVFG
jgi:hypothetical protein